MTDPGSPGRPELRASDAEREQTAEVLRKAAAEGRLTVEELEDRLGSVYAVPTRRELEGLIADVTLHPLVGDRTPAPMGDGRLTVREGPGGSGWVVSIMGGHDRGGRWRVAPRCNVVNVMGGSELDFNDAELSDRVTHVNVVSIMGGGEIRVPNGVEVEVSKFAFMGGNDVRLEDEVPPAGGPVIHIRLVSIMGSTSVRRGRKLSKSERRRRRELEKAERRELGGHDGAP